jgi:NitT/TauT family transport system substrate-binding protein
MSMRRTLALIAAAGLLVLAGCSHVGNRAGTTGTTTNKVKIMVGGIDKVIYLPAKLTEQLGYFKQEGLNVELMTEPAGVQAETAMLSGQVDGVVGFYDHTIDLQGKGKQAESVVQLASVPGEVEVVAKGQAAAIRSPKDFRGKRLGVTGLGSSTNFITHYLAVNAGLKVSDITPVAVGAGNTFISAVQKGAIDAGMTTEPTVSRLLKTGDAKVLLDMRTEQGTRTTLGGLYPASSLYMTTAYVNSHKETVQKLANALVKTLKWIKSHTPEEIAAKMPADYYAGDQQLYVSALKNTIGMFTADGIMPAEGPQSVLNVLSRFDPSVQGKTIDLAKTYTTEFTTNANA